MPPARAVQRASAAGRGADRRKRCRLRRRAGRRCSALHLLLLAAALVAQRELQAVVGGLEAGILQRALQAGGVALQQVERVVAVGDHVGGDAAVRPTSRRTSMRPSSGGSSLISKRFLPASAWPAMSTATPASGTAGGGGVAAARHWPPDGAEVGAVCWAGAVGIIGCVLLPPALAASGWKAAASVAAVLAAAASCAGAAGFLSAARAAAGSPSFAAGAAAWSAVLAGSGGSGGRGRRCSALAVAAAPVGRVASWLGAAALPPGRPCRLHGRQRPRISARPARRASPPRPRWRAPR